MGATVPFLVALLPIGRQPVKRTIEDDRVLKPGLRVGDQGQ